MPVTELQKTTMFSFIYIDMTVNIKRRILFRTPMLLSEPSFSINAGPANATAYGWVGFRSQMHRHLLFFKVSEGVGV